MKNILLISNCFCLLSSDIVSFIIFNVLAVNYLKATLILTISGFKFEPYFLMRMNYFAANQLFCMALNFVEYINCLELMSD